MSAQLPPGTACGDGIRPAPTGAAAAARGRNAELARLRALSCHSASGCRGKVVRTGYKAHTEYRSVFPLRSITISSLFLFFFFKHPRSKYGLIILFFFFFFQPSLTKLQTRPHCTTRFICTANPFGMDQNNNFGTDRWKCLDCSKGK